MWSCGILKLLIKNFIAWKDSKLIQKILITRLVGKGSGTTQRFTPSLGFTSLYLTYWYFYTTPAPLLLLQHILPTLSVTLLSPYLVLNEKKWHLWNLLQLPQMKDHVRCTPLSFFHRFYKWSSHWCKSPISKKVTLDRFISTIISHPIILHLFEAQNSFSNCYKEKIEVVLSMFTCVRE